MFKRKSKLLKRIGAGIVAGLCAFTAMTADIPHITTVSAAEQVLPKADTVIAEAATLLGGNYKYGCKGYYNMYSAGYTPVAYSVDYTRSQGVDCTGLIYYTLTNLGYSTSGFSWNHPVPVDTEHWLYYNNPTITYGGVTQPIEIEKSRVKSSEHPYWEKTDGTTIDRGSIVIGDPSSGTDHAWIYIGEFDNKQAVKDYLAGIGVNKAYINDRTVRDGGDGGNHWRIEANGDYGVIVDNDTSGKVMGTLSISTFRVTNPNATFFIQKTDIDTGRIVGISKVDGSYAIYGVYTDSACTNKVNEINIGANGIGKLELPLGTYYVKELVAPTGYEISDKVYPLVPDNMVYVDEVQEHGAIRINKQAEDGVRQRKFMVSYVKDGVIYRDEISTNTIGLALVDNLSLYNKDGTSIKYTIAEIDVPKHIERPIAQSVILSEADKDKDYTVDLVFRNEYLRGSIVLHKTHADGNQGDRQFTVTGDGQTWEITTHGDEPATLEGLRIYDDNDNLITYTIHEENCPPQYVQPEDQNVELLVDKATDVYFINATTSGGLIVQKTHEDGNQGDRTFDITGSDGSTRTVTTHGDAPTLVTDLDVYDADGDPISYTIHETNTPDEYVQPADQSVTLDPDKIKTVKFDNVLKRGTITVEKVDADTKTPIKGAKFDVTCDETIDLVYGRVRVPAGMTICTLETDENGKATTPKILPIGHTYTLTEVYVPDGYVAHEDVKVELLMNGNILDYEAYVQEKPTDIYVSKTDFTTGELLEGAELSIVDSNGSTVASWTSKKGEQHRLRAELIAGADYTLVETKAPAGYKIADPVKFTVSTDGTVDKVEMKDERALRDVTVEKIDAETKTIIAGAVMQIIDADGNVVHEWTSENTKHNVSNLIIGATYTLHEVAPPAGYAYAPDFDFTVPEVGEVAQYTMEDKPTDVKVHKIDERGKEVSGATLQIINGDGKVVDEWVTTEKDHEIKGVLSAGISYTLREKDVPKGYTMSADVQFTVSLDGSLDEVTMNEKSTKIQFSKKSLTGADEVVGAHLWVEDETGKIIDEWVSEEKPHIIEALLIAGKKYILHEEVAPKGYIVADDMEFTVNEDGELQIVTMYDDYTEIHISKLNKDTGLPLAGAVLQIVDGEEVIEEWTSTEKAHVIKAKLEAGKSYVLHEVSAPDGFVLADDVEFTVSDDGSIDEITMDDAPTMVYISKKSITGSDELEGAKLKITDSDGNTIDEWTSGKTSHVIVGKLITGKEYTLTEIIAPDGYTIANSITFTVNEDGTPQTITMHDEEQSGSIEIHKSTEGMTDIEGIRFVLRGTSDHGTDVEREAVTDEKGIAVFEKIPVGTYEVVEDAETVPAAYLVADAQNVSVMYAETTVAEFFNDTKKGSVEVHKITEGQLNVSGIKFILSGISDNGTEVSIEAVTNDDGIALFDGIPVGTYTITEDEKTTPAAYLVADKQEVTVMSAETTIREIFNEEKCGSVEVHKTTKNNGNIANITFVLQGVSDSGRNISISAVTDENGVAVFENIPVGTYEIFEDKDTVPSAYLVADKQEVTVLYAETTTATVFNGEKTGSIEVYKTTEGQLNIEGIIFILEGVSDSGTEVKVEAKTDKDGKAVFSGIPVGTYTITEDEKNVPAAYMVADKTEVTVLYAETVTKKIHNDERTGSISVQKKTEGMKDISGIKFILEGVSDSGRTVKLEAVTDKDGMATFSNIPIGTYTITEDGSTVPAGYLVADAQKVTVYDAKTTNVTVTNKKISLTSSSTPTTTTTTTTTSNPGTGAGVGGTLAVAALAFAMAIVSKKRKNS